MTMRSKLSKLRSFRIRLALALLVVGAVPLLLLSVVTVRFQRASLLRAERELEVAAVDEASYAIDERFTEADRGCERIADLLTDARIAEDEVRLALAREAMTRAPDVDEVDIFDPDGTFIDALLHDGVEAPHPAELPPRSELSPDRITWRTHTTPGGDRDLLGVRAMRRDGALRGWVIGHLAFDSLTQKIADISRSRFGSEDRLVVIDDMLRPVASGGAEGAGSFFASQDLAGRLGMTQKKFSQRFEATINFNSSGEAYIATVRSLPSWRWAIVATRPETTAYADLEAARRAFFIVAGAFALLAIVTGSFIAARTTRPLAALVRLTRAYAQRDFASRSTVHTGDELEELGDAMTTMADALLASDEEIARRATVEANLSRYLPTELAQKIARGEAQLALGGTRQRVTVLFADLVSFTPFAERSPSDEVVALLNEVFTVASEIVFRHGGMVDKFIGDSIMAVFGTTELSAQQESCAMAAAEDLHRFMAAAASEWKARWGFDVQLGIGVSTGEAVVGNLGSETRMEYTVIGDTVNVAARLETLARGGQTLVTSEVARGAGAQFAFTSLGERALRGKAAAIEILELSV